MLAATFSFLALHWLTIVLFWLAVSMYGFAFVSFGGAEDIRYPKWMAWIGIALTVAGIISIFL